MSIMVQAVKNVLNPDKWYMSVTIFISLMIFVISWVWVAGKVYHRLEILETSEHISMLDIKEVVKEWVKEEFANFKNSLILELDDRYQKKN